MINLAPNNSPRTLTKKIIQYLLSKPEVHYQDLMDYLGISRKTVAKYLDRAAAEVAPLGIKLIRKRGQGIHLAGNTDKLLAAFPSNVGKVDDETRRLQLLSTLITAKQPMLLADLADHFFVSKSTLERDLRQLKSEYGLKLQTTAAGVQFAASEADVRTLMGKLLQHYWGQEVHQDQTGSITRTFEVPASLSQYVDKSILDKTQAVLSRFINTLSTQVNEYEYESLLIHTTIALQRIKNGEYVTHAAVAAGAGTALSPNTKRLVKMLSEAFDLPIPKDEAVYLNMHVVAIEDGYINLNQGGLVDQDLTAWLRLHLGGYDDTLLRNLALHLRPALVRVSHGISITNPYREDVKKNFPMAFQAALDLTVALKKKTQLTLSEDEIAYLALHFQSFFERRHGADQDVRIAIVCSTGYGTAELLRQRVKDKFPEMEVTATLSVNELMHTQVDADIIISTIPLKMNDSRVIQVSPFLNDQEMTLLGKLEKNIRKSKYAKHAFLNMLSPATTIVNVKCGTKKAAINDLTAVLEQAGYVDHDMAESALAREALASTVIGNCAIPHGDMKHVVKPAIGLLTSKSGIPWDGERVHVVFFVALNKSVEAKMDDIYSYFYELIQDPGRMRQLGDATTLEDVTHSIQDKTPGKEGTMQND
nr:BglG family transcription antiterminator [Lacticaseibacillus jixianensis]